MKEGGSAHDDVSGVSSTLHSGFAESRGHIAIRLFSMAGLQASATLQQRGVFPHTTRPAQISEHCKETADEETRMSGN